MKSVAAFFSGLLFAVGLVIAGMTYPANIVGFLDFFGEWKPALALVMVGAVGIYAALAPLVMKRRVPLFNGAFDIPTLKKIDLKLIAGSAIFGIGWGIGGFCPGPAFVVLGTGARDVFLFSLAMIAGILIYRLIKGGESMDSDNSSCG